MKAAEAPCERTQVKSLAHLSIRHAPTQFCEARPHFFDGLRLRLGHGTSHVECQG
jgi:hypothetical protein